MSPTLVRESPDQNPYSPPGPLSRRPRIGPLLSLLLLVGLSTSLTTLPLSRTIEKRLCEAYYLDPPSLLRPQSRHVPESLCKIPPVQRSLAYAQGLLETLIVAGDLLAAVPVGSFLAVRWGRRAVLLLNLLPRLFLLAWAVALGGSRAAGTGMPTGLVALGAALSWLGGDCVFNSVVYGLAADVTDDHVIRATYFGYMSSVSYVINFVGPALAAAAMGVRIWLPFALAIGLLVLAVPLIAMLQQAGADGAGGAGHSRDESTALLSTRQAKAAATKTRPYLLASVAQRLRSLLAVVTSHPRNFTLLLASFFLTALASSDTKLLPQYISRRYGWTFASAGYLLSGKAVVNFALLTLVVPAVLRSRHVRNPSGSPDRANKHYAVLCLAVSVAGALLIAASQRVWALVPSLVVYSVGAALPVFTLSLLRSPAVVPAGRAGDASRDGTPAAGASDADVFSVVMLVKTVGSLAGAPVMAASWAWGIAVGGPGQGMPFFVSSVSYLAALWVVAGMAI